MAQSVDSGRGTTVDADGLLSRMRTPFQSRFVFRRALGSGEDSTSTTSSSGGLLTSETLFPSSTPPTSSKAGHGISQIGVEGILAVIALGILGAVIVWRCAFLKYRSSTAMPFPCNSTHRRAAGYRNRPYSLRLPQPAHTRGSGEFDAQFIRSTGSLVLSPTFLHTGLMPLVDGRGVQINSPREGERRVHGRRVTGPDVGEGGRRGGGRCTEDDDDDGGVEDELPAYEVGKKPPGYDAAIGSTGRPDVVEISLPEPALQHSREPQVALSRSDGQIPEYTVASSQNSPAHGRILESPSHVLPP